MTPQELKNSILQLAIQGKLVEQRAEEGTGAELLEKILAAKNAEGAKGKGEKSHAKSAKSAKVGSCVSREEIPDDEKPFDIPESWEWVRLGEIGSWASGATPSRTHSEYYGGSIPWLKTGDLTDGYVSSIPEFITDLALEKNSVRLNPVGSVLMAMYGATIGKLGILQIAATTNQACCACIPYDGVWNKYLFYYLMARRKAFIKMGEGGAQPNISKEKIVNALIPLPPLAEQKRIVAKIEELLPLIDRYEKAWSRLEDFNKRFPVDMQKSLLQMAIQGRLVEQQAEEGTGRELLEKILAAKNAKGAKGKGEKSHAKSAKSAKVGPCVSREGIPDDEKPFEIPESWVWVRLSSVTDMLSGFAFKSTDFKVNGKYRLLRGINLGVGDVRWKETVYVDSITERMAEYRLRSGDVLIGLDRPWISEGTRVAIFDDSKETYLVQRVLRLREIGLLTSSFITFLLHSSLLSNSIGDKTTGISVPHISPGQVGNLFVPLPPLAEQKRIVAKLEELLPLCERLK